MDVLFLDIVALIALLYGGSRIYRRWRMNRQVERSLEIGAGLTSRRRS